jgi:hypothetical protein
MNGYLLQHKGSSQELEQHLNILHSSQSVPMVIATTLQGNAQLQPSGLPVSSLSLYTYPAHKEMLCLLQ